MKFGERKTNQKLRTKKCFYQTRRNMEKKKGKNGTEQIKIHWVSHVEEKITKIFYFKKQLPKIRESILTRFEMTNKIIIVAFGKHLK